MGRMEEKREFEGTIDELQKLGEEVLGRNEAATVKTCGGCLFVQAYVLGLEVHALVDSGSCISILSVGKAEEIGVLGHLKEDCLELVGISGNRLESKGSLVDLPLHVNNNLCVLAVVVAEIREDMILGQDYLEKHGFNYP